MFINMGEGKIFYSADLYRKNTSLKNFPVHKTEAFRDDINLTQGPIHLAFATIGEFKNLKILNVY